MDQLPSRPAFERTALNRVTFGANARDLKFVADHGWEGWVDEQTAPPAGDDAALADVLDQQTMHIKYNGQPHTKDIVGWPDVDQYRKLKYLDEDVPALWDMARKVEQSVAANELTRIQQELNAATWIRNTHAVFQLREFTVDFWNNHFNIGRQADVFASAALPSYDADVIRPRALGNFRDLLGAVAASPAMLRYLNNADSSAAHPNENYARELLELHTLGGGAYSGINARASEKRGATAIGFSDQDIIQAAHALSGWTVEQGQTGPNGPLPFTGKFLYNPPQHSGRAGLFLGADLSKMKAPRQQGEAVLDMVAAHPSTADFVCTKLARRIFGDAPPPEIIARARTVWMENQHNPQQITVVLRAILLSREIGAPMAGGPKLRRPYERLIAFFRTTDTNVRAFDLADTAVAALGDGIYVWPTPDGRPDTNAHWLTTSVNLYNWNLMLLILRLPQFTTTLAAQTPKSATGSAANLVQYWVGRMVGYSLRPEATAALIEDAEAPDGVMTAFKAQGIAAMEVALRRLVALIGAAPEFGFR